MTEIITPKLGLYRNTLYYYKQKYVNWEYVASTSFDDIIVLDVFSAFEFETPLRSIRGVSHYGDTLLEMAASRCLTEQGLKEKYVTVSIKVTSSYQMFVQLIDIQNSLPFPSNFSISVNKYLSTSNPTYSISYDVPYTDLVSAAQDDTITARLRLRHPYPIGTITLKRTISDVDKTLPYSTNFDVIDVKTYNQYASRLSLKDSTYIQFTPFRSTTFTNHINLVVENRTSTIRLQGFVSKLKVHTPTCIAEDNFDVVSFQYTPAYFPGRLLFISSSYRSTL
jgi:hypothetical protein